MYIGGYNGLYSGLGDITPVWGGTGTFSTSFGTVLPSRSSIPWRYEPLSTIADLGDGQFFSLLEVGGATTMPSFLGAGLLGIGVSSASVWSALRDAWQRTELGFGGWWGNPFGSAAYMRPGAGQTARAPAQAGGPRFDYTPREITSPEAEFGEEAGETAAKTGGKKGKPKNQPKDARVAANALEARWSTRNLRIKIDGSTATLTTNDMTDNKRIHNNVADALKKYGITTVIGP